MAAAGAMTASCDSGDIYETNTTGNTSTYKLKVTGQIVGQDSWPSGYTLCVAAFNDNSEYSLTQKQVMRSNIDTDGMLNITLTNIPTTATTVGLYVTNNLRGRVVCFNSVKITDKQKYSDTIRIDLDGVTDLSIMAGVQTGIFDNNAYNCSMCHGDSNPRASLTLTDGNSYTNLVGTASTRVEGATRVVPGNAEQSVLYQALQSGNPAGLRYDHSGLANNTMLQLIKDWIEGLTEKE